MSYLRICHGWTVKRFFRKRNCFRGNQQYLHRHFIRWMIEKWRKCNVKDYVLRNIIHLYKLILLIHYVKMKSIRVIYLKGSDVVGNFAESNDLMPQSLAQLQRKIQTNIWIIDSLICNISEVLKWKRFFCLTTIKTDANVAYWNISLFR